MCGLMLSESRMDPQEAHEERKDRKGFDFSLRHCERGLLERDRLTENVALNFANVSATLSAHRCRYHFMHYSF
jgi:hypothetical protein